MKITIEIDATTEEVKDFLVPSEKQTEFTYKAYDAFVKAMQDVAMKQVDPFNFTGMRGKK